MMLLINFLICSQKWSHKLQRIEILKKDLTRPFQVFNFVCIYRLFVLLLRASMPMAFCMVICNFSVIWDQAVFHLQKTCCEKIGRAGKPRNIWQYLFMTSVETIAWMDKNRNKTHVLFIRDFSKTYCKSFIFVFETQ